MAYELRHSTRREVLPGHFYPLGATLGPEGVNFAIFSKNATEVFVLLFDEPEGDPTDVIRLPQRTRFIWHGLVRGIGAGQIYGVKARGPYDPARGLRFNEHKLLLDPYAKALTSKPANRDNLLLGYDAYSPERDLSFDTRDSTRIAAKAIVVDDSFDWQGDAPPNIPLESLIIYEVHLKGFTAHPSSGVAQPGTYLGFIEKIPHLKKLGVNAVEFLPLHEFYVEDFLRDRGLTNYWGYNTIAFFAPESSYSTCRSPACQVAEFKTLVRELHRAGIEVILDVVYNHTGEGSEMGPTVSFRGIDNPSYYVLTGTPAEPGRFYRNETGCGNCLDLSKPPVLRMVMDSLRYWVEVMHVDGFRFDLASVLGREDGHFRQSASFFDAVTQDPVLSRIDLIAEPWDLGTYQVGNFPVDWSEWNGRFRDTVRKFARGERGQVRDLGWRLTGSADLYGDDGRSAYNSINFVTCHDGFTLHDLVSYDRKHNEANLENGRDGTDDNNSWNCGEEGSSNDPAILRLRRQMAKNFVAALLFSRGTPMLLGGDEFLRSQQGNNNAYCQDNPISWFDWREAERNAEFTAFICKAIALMRRFPAFQRRKFFEGRQPDDGTPPDIRWFGSDLNAPSWEDPELRTLACQVRDERPERLDDGHLIFWILNAHWNMQWVRLPALSEGLRWRRVMDTSIDPPDDLVDPEESVVLDPQGVYITNPRSVVLLLTG